MLKTLMVASVLTGLVTPALAEYWVVKDDPSTQKCSIVEKSLKPIKVSLLPSKLDRKPSTLFKDKDSVAVAPISKRRPISDAAIKRDRAALRAEQ
jgi:hypothetical protein